MSNVKPAASNFLALPPAGAFFSKTVTSNPSFARKHAADNPENPAPIIAT
jgi:hypothetical protein